MRTRIPNSRWLEALRGAASVARQGGDAEGVHQLRVAAGRLDTWLRMLGWRVLRDDLAWVRERAAAVRDLDVVQITEGLPDDVVGWLRERRGPEHDQLVATLDDPRFQALASALSWLAPVSRRQALDYSERQREAVRRAGRGVTSATAPIASVHRLRRAVRRLRYAREWLGTSTRSLQALQDALGAFNDAAVALRVCEAFPDQATREATRQLLLERLEARRQQAFLAWAAAALRLFSRPGRRVTG